MHDAAVEKVQNETLYYLLKADESFNLNVEH